MDHGMKAAELFLGGYNCAQSVAVAFCDVTGLEEKQTAVHRTAVIMIIASVWGDSFRRPGKQK